tara:strand:- start:779 stop:1780 length:1002 start_codon:yes stop_codon:yes gene_type:complete
MDPISQGTLGGALAQTIANRKNIAKVTLIGCLAGMAPDLDVLIQSNEDPILFLEFHRQFTHSLIFIPIGALIVASALFWFFKKTLTFHVVYLAALLGYATHALLDACTSYGTLLFWPFSNVRIAWNNVSVVDPLFTIPALILVICALSLKKRLYTALALTWCFLYLSLGFIQHERTYRAALKIANEREHNPQRLTLKPSFGNLILWKAVYEHEGRYHVDAIRTLGTTTWCSGESIEVFNYEKHLPTLDRDSQQSIDIERFRWFSQDYLGYDYQSQLVTDIRYSMIPSQIKPMWGLQINPIKNQRGHAVWIASRNLDEEQLDLFKDMLTGKSCT